ncbi:plasmid mobilization relaxosome protein MobC, partial [Vibrio parahaemolyticus]|nr:plasmid mobilization relaxosome protein MobC [Vibrio parahaemolyticus]MCF9925015.1 plasmid mobilization relaxosome protein MobC [Vibrio parahaemolyticus]
MTRENRSKTIKFRVTQAEFDLIEANRGSFSMSDYMRKTALKAGKIKQKQVVLIDPKLLSSISRIGNLLNQIARVANTHAKSGYPMEAARVTLQIKSIKKCFRRYWKMLVKFFTPTPEAGPFGALNYLLGDKNRSVSPELLHGTPEITKQLLLSSNSKNPYTAGCLSFAPEESDISEELQ